MFIKIRARVKRSISLCGFWLILPAAVLVLFPFEWPISIWPAYARAFNIVFATALAHAIGHITVFLLAGLLVLKAMPRLRLYPFRYMILMVLGSLGEEFLKLFVLGRWQAPIVSDMRSLSFDVLGFVLVYVLVRLWWRSELLRQEEKMKHIPMPEKARK